MNDGEAVKYCWHSADGSHTDGYLLRPVLSALHQQKWGVRQKRVFDLGCGNGAMTAILAQQGFEMTGVDPSGAGVSLAKTAHPDLRIEVGSCYDDLAAKYGQFPVVISLEVVEHVARPRTFATCIYNLLEPGGTAIISTPYHGYWKNLALAVTGRLDAHFTALWDSGHIKFWSVKTLSTLLRESGFDVSRVVRAGRLPIIAKSMIAIAHRPIG